MPECRGAGEPVDPHVNIQDGAQADVEACPGVGLMFGIAAQLHVEEPEILIPAGQQA